MKNLHFIEGMRNLLMVSFIAATNVKEFAEYQKQVEDESLDPIQTVKNSIKLYMEVENKNTLEDISIFKMSERNLRNSYNEFKEIFFKNMHLSITGIYKKTVEEVFFMEFNKDIADAMFQLVYLYECLTPSIPTTFIN